MHHISIFLYFPFWCVYDVFGHFQNKNLDFTQGLGNCEHGFPWRVSVYRLCENTRLWNWRGEESCSLCLLAPDCFNNLKPLVIWCCTTSICSHTQTVCSYVVAKLCFGCLLLTLFPHVLWQNTLSCVKVVRPMPGCNFPPCLRSSGGGDWIHPLTIWSLTCFPMVWYFTYPSHQN